MKKRYESPTLRRRSFAPEETILAEIVLPSAGGGTIPWPPKTGSDPFRWDNSGGDYQFD